MLFREKTPKFDVSLDTSLCSERSNAVLTLTLRLGFKQINPPAGEMQGTYHDYGDANEPARMITRWNTSEWAAWKKDFVASAQDYWDGKFWLLNNFPLPGPDGLGLNYTIRGERYVANIDCRMRLVAGEDGKGGNHHEIEVVHLHPSSRWFGSNAVLYDSNDTRENKKGVDSKGADILQKAHVHEVGHLLGLDHVDVDKAACKNEKNNNASVCYGVKDEDMYSVMGKGMHLRPEHAVPWRKAMVLMTGFGSVQVSTDWQPKLMRIYPRTLKAFGDHRARTARMNTLHLRPGRWM